MKKTAFITYAAIIAALYVILTLIANAFGLANFAIQVRFSEALTILPLFTPAAIPGLYIGCLLSNIITGCIAWDIVIGPIATLIGALGTFALRKKHPVLATLPPIISNTLIVPFILSYAYKFDGSVFYFMATVCIGEVISCGFFGYGLYLLLKKHQKNIFGV